MTMLIEKGETLVTLNRGLAILEALAGASPSRGLDHMTLARRLKFTRSTLFRYLARLQDGGFVECADERGRYRLGPAIVRLAAVVHSREFSDLARNSIRELAARTGETVYATVYDHPHTVAVLVANDSSHVGPQIALGSRRPLHASASGKVYLAHERPHVAAAYLAGPLECRTSHTVTHCSTLLREFETVRQVGYAIDQGESSEGVCGVAAPVFDYAGNVVGTLSVVVVAPQLAADQIQVLVTPLVASAAALSTRLGYVDNREPERGTNVEAR